MLVQPLNQPTVSPLLTIMPARVKYDTVKLSPFQDNDDIDPEDVCDNDAPNLDIATIQAIAALCSGLDFSNVKFPTDVIQIIINSITSQAITPAEQVLGKFTCRKLKNMNGLQVKESNSINFMIYKCLVNLSFALLKTMQSYYNIIGSIM